MTTSDARAEYRPALFSLPEGTPATILRIGRWLVRAGYTHDAIDMYERFITGLEQRALVPIVPGPGGARAVVPSPGSRWLFDYAPLLGNHVRRPPA